MQFALLLQVKFSWIKCTFFFYPMLFLSQISMPSPDEMQPCWPSPSLWSLIAEQVPGSELPRIRGALGNPLVDMYIDLYAEVRALQECCCSIFLFLSRLLV